MSLAYAVQRAAPYYQMLDTSKAMLNGQDPFNSVMPGNGQSQTPAMGGLPALAQMLLQSPASSQGGSLLGGATQSPAAAMPAVASLLGGSSGAMPSATTDPLGAPIYTPPAYKPLNIAGAPAPLLNTANALGQNRYDLMNFPHYAAPSGSNLPFIGANYKGAQNGYYYDPYTDRYVVNENSLIDNMKNQGAVTNLAKIQQQFGLVPQTPSTGKQLLNTILGAVGSGVGNKAGSSLSSSIFQKLLGGNSTSSSTGDTTGSFFGLGNTSPGSNGNPFNYNLGGSDPVSALTNDLGLSSGGSDPSGLTNGLTSDSGYSLFNDASSTGGDSFSGFPGQGLAVNFIGNELGLPAGVSNTVNLGLDIAEQNYPAAAMNVIQNAPGYFNDLKTNIGNGLSDVGNGISDVASGIGDTISSIF